MRDIRIAAAIFNAPLGQTAENLKKMTAFCRDAAENGASLVCFPELSVTGYGSGASIVPHALSMDDPSLSVLIQTSKDLNLVILAGMAEKGTDGKMYATHAVFIPGKAPQAYRKLHISPPEKAVFTGGDTIPVFHAGGFTFGVQLCYDAHFPDLTTRMAEKGVDAVFIPHASPRGTPDEKFVSWMRHIPARAFDNGIFVIVCNQTGDNGNGLTFPGLAFIADPSGHIIGSDLSGNERLVYADLKKASLDGVRSHTMRYFFPNRRTDLSSLD
jgi:N-carbamoylputrescine amidase